MALKRLFGTASNARYIYINTKAYIYLTTALNNGILCGYIGVQGEAESEGPSESECRPYIEKALKELEAGEAVDDDDSKEDVPTVEITTDDSDHDGDGDGDDDAQESAENDQGGDKHSSEKNDEVPSTINHHHPFFSIILCFRQKMTVVTKQTQKQRKLIK